MAPENVLEVRNLSKRYGAVRALEDVSFELEEGSILGLVGDNGAGKTTLLRILMGELRPTSGEIWLEGERVEFKDAKEAMDRGIAITHQELALVDTASGWKNFFMGREKTKKIGPFQRLDIAGMREETKERIGRYGFDFDINRNVEEYSGGQRQVLAVARAIESNPKILLLDEPTTQLSRDGRKEVLELVTQINKREGISVILVSHDLDVIKETCDNIMVLKGGKIPLFSSSDSVDKEQILDRMLAG